MAFDAGAKAYSSTIYITGEVTRGRKVSETVVKVFPLKTLSIPRLELCACLLLSNLLENVQNALRDVVDVKYVYCWSDSLIALFCIKEESRRRIVIIENMVQKIRRKVVSVDWRHCPTEVNDARGREVPKRQTGLREMKNWPREEKVCWPDDKCQLTRIDR